MIYNRAGTYDEQCAPRKTIKMQTKAITSRDRGRCQCRSLPETFIHWSGFLTEGPRVDSQCIMSSTRCMLAFSSHLSFFLFFFLHAYTASILVCLGAAESHPLRTKENIQTQIRMQRLSRNARGACGSARHSFRTEELPSPQVVKGRGASQKQIYRHEKYAH